ncbi:MAG TPA: hypothetical protein VG839_08240 [Asticcacaulis sp.]|nr:hypothetical protein [Asticcacaulis sp.]
MVQPRETPPTDIKPPPPIPVPPVKAEDHQDYKEPPQQMNTGVPPPVSTGPHYVAARWSKFPSSENFADYYPERASNDEVEGSATIECQVTTPQGNVKCRVLSETPSGYGFGTAAVKVIEKYGRADTSAGEVQVGSLMKVTSRFQLQ